MNTTIVLTLAGLILAFLVALVLNPAQASLLNPPLMGLITGLFAYLQVSKHDPPAPPTS